MANEWFYTQNGQAAPEPVSPEKLKLLAAAGQLQATDLVWKEGMAQWVAAASIKGLFGKVPSGEMPAFGGAKPASGDGIPVKKEAAVKPRPPAATGTGTGGGLAEMHPLLVLLLSAVTLGLFGLFYAYVVSTAYTELAAKRTADGAGRPFGKARHPVAVLLLSYLTLGAYLVYWTWCVLRECAAYSGRRDVNPRAELALMLACPPYTVYVIVFRLPELVRRCQTLASVPETAVLGHSYLFLNPLMFPALPFLGMAYQDGLNQVWFTAP